MSPLLMRGVTLAAHNSTMVSYGVPPCLTKLLAKAIVENLFHQKKLSVTFFVLVLM